MQPHQQRVVDEKTELDSKLEKLRAFATITNKTFASLPTDECNRLLRQQKAMTEYSAILGERIAAF